MEYTKSELRELKKKISHILDRINAHAKIVSDDAIYFMDYAVLKSLLNDLAESLSPLKKWIIDNDEYHLAIEINNIFTPEWSKYCTEANKNQEMIPQQALTTQDIINDLRAWIREYEAAHPKQESSADTPPVADTTMDDEKDKDKDIFDQESLKSLFIPCFFDKDYTIQDTSNESIKLSRYDVFCKRLELILEDQDKKPTQKDIGGIAYMIYCSRYAKQEYRKPKRIGEKGCYANLIKLFFDIVDMSHPSDCRPSKYNKLSKNLVDMFGNILKWE